MSEETTPDYGPQKRPASARQIEAQRRFLANESASGSSDASLCSGAGRKAPADDPDVQGTGLPGFAELRARAIQGIKHAETSRSMCQKNGDEESAQYWGGSWTAFKTMLDLLDDIEADAKSGS